MAWDYVFVCWSELPLACAGGEWADGEGGLGAGHQDPHWDVAHGVWQWPLCLHIV